MPNQVIRYNIGCMQFFPLVYLTGLSQELKETGGNRNCGSGPLSDLPKVTYPVQDIEGI